MKNILAFSHSVSPAAFVTWMDADASTGTHFWDVVVADSAAPAAIDSSIASTASS